MEAADGSHLSELQKSIQAVAWSSGGGGRRRRTPGVEVDDGGGGGSPCLSAAAPFASWVVPTLSRKEEQTPEVEADGGGGRLPASIWTAAEAPCPSVGGFFFFLFS